MMATKPFAPSTPPYSLALFRLLFGLLMLIAVVRFFAHGWIAKEFVTPRLHFAYEEWGLGLIRPLPLPAMYVLFGVMGSAALGIALGLFYRASCALFGLTFTYVHLIDKTYYLNHYYLITLLTFALFWMPLGRSLSLDAWRLGQPQCPSMPAWPLWWLRGQAAWVYFCAGLAKCQSDWLLHAQPMRIWLRQNLDFPLLGPLFRLPEVAFGISWLGCAFDLSAGFIMLLGGRLRRPFYVVIVLFHLITAALFPIGLFPWLMIALSSCFFAPDWPRRLLPGRFTALSPPQRSTGSHLWPLTLCALIQIALALRHYAYPGPVLWTERGFRLAWQVMVMEKNGDAQFTVHDAATGRAYAVNNRDYLTPLQEKMMATQPDMIAQYARWLAADFRSRGLSAPRVTAEVWVALNGRRSQRFVDPAADVAQQPASAWLLPFVGP